MLLSTQIWQRAFSGCALTEVVPHSFTSSSTSTSPFSCGRGSSWSGEISDVSRNLSNPTYVRCLTTSAARSRDSSALRSSKTSRTRPQLSSASSSDSHTKPDDPIWVRGKVPDHFWADKSNKRSYMNWLGGKLGYSSPSDWYRITAKAFFENNGGGLLMHFKGSPSLAVTSTLAEHSFLPWLFNSTSRGYFKNLENRKKYITWLMDKVGVKSENELKYNDFLDHHGGWLLIHYGEGSPQRLIDSLLVSTDWASQPRDRKPLNHWSSIENQRAFLDEVGARIGVKGGDLSPWYRVDKTALKKLGCNSLLRQCYDSSHYRMLKKVYPEFDWNPWKFKNPPRNLSEEVGIVEKALAYLESELKLSKPEDWYRLRWTQLNEVGVKAVIKSSGGLYHALKTYQSLIPWEEEKFETYA